MIHLCIVNYNPTKDGLNNRYSELKRKNIPFDDFDENRTYFTEGTFDYIYDIFYIDSVSVFDLDYYINTKNALKCICSYKEHLSYLLKQLRDDNSDSDLPDDVKNQINDVNEKISRIIGGESYYSPILSLGNFKEEAYFFKPDDDEQLRVNISSGIQQISIIQILLHNHKLLPGTFMIIDEPEVNLHPEWQIKFAEILILLVKELDINYI